MTTITVPRELLEQALNALSAPNHCVFSEPPICVDIRAALLAPATAPDRNPMHEGEIKAAWLGQNIEEPMPYTFVLGIRSAERFNGIKEKP